MPYTPTNNPYVPGDPYMYDLKWIVGKINELIADYKGNNAEIIAIKQYLETLDVSEKLDEMLADGDFTPLLQSLVDQYVIDTNNRLDGIDNDIATLSRRALILENAAGLQSEAPAFPLEMFKSYSNGTTGDYYRVQGITATYNNDDSIKNIYAWCDVNNTASARLYKITAGNRSTGAGWTYSYTDNLPPLHGSCISVVESRNKILVGWEQGSGKFYEYDLITDTYALIDLSSITTSGILGIVYDEKTNTYLMCANSNNKMYVLDENYNVIRTYEHYITYGVPNSYLYQGYDYKNGLEYRTFNTPNGRTNGIMVYDTFTGNLLKVININCLYGELESVNVRNGVALLAFDNVYYDNNNIEMDLIAEAYIGGKVDKNALQNIQQKFNCGYPFTAFLTNGNTIAAPNLRYCNTHSNNEMCRYVGVGTVDNPIKSGAVMVAMVLLLKKLYPTCAITITVSGNNTNTDDNGFYISNATGIDIVVDGGGYSINHLFCYYANNIELKNVTIVGNGASRRNNDGRLILTSNNNLIIRTASTAPIIWLIDNYRVLLYQALTGTHTSTNSESYRNIYMPGSKTRYTAAHFASNGDISS